jgi:two-component system response regulator NreC
VVNTTRTLVIEDHDVMRFGLVTLLNREKDITVVAEAGDGQAALCALGKVAVDVILLDLTLPDVDGLQFIRLLTARYPHLPVLVTTMHDELRYGDRAIAAGARGFVMKSEAPGVLLEAIRKVAAGGHYASDELLARMSNVNGDQPQAATTHLPLTNREIEVLRLLGLGLSSSEIAQRLHRSVKTVDAHRENIKKKLTLKNANELVRYAVCWVEEETMSVKLRSDTRVPEGVVRSPMPMDLAMAR